MNKGSLFIISGPSGSGKDTVLKEVFKLLPNVAFSISTITRPMRPGEIEGEKYNFVSKEKFLSMLENNELLEFNEYIGNFYGTPRKPVDKALAEGRDMILEVDVNGAFKVKEKMKDAVSIFIMPPSFTELKRRLSSRGTDDEAVINKRMNEALREIENAVNYDYIVVNDNILAAAQDVEHIILSSRLRTARKKEIINEVLEKC
ncbi:MAG: guanylate kinase [Ruminococcaceae bacterium]|nr:guanylate kinase [Oscillospiraceae bacterium]